MSNVIIYDSVGKILRTVSSPPSMRVMQKQEGESLLFGDADLQIDYIDQGVVTPRQAQTTSLNKITLTADGVDAVTISNAPNGTFTAVNTTTQETVRGPISGTDTFSTTVIGTYKIKIESWPYLDFEVTINAL